MMMTALAFRGKRVFRDHYYFLAHDDDFQEAILHEHWPTLIDFAHISIETPPEHEFCVCYLDFVSLHNCGSNM